MWMGATTHPSVCMEAPPSLRGRFLRFMYMQCMSLELAESAFLNKRLQALCQCKGCDRSGRKTLACVQQSALCTCDMPQTGTAIAAPAFVGSWSMRKKPVSSLLTISTAAAPAAWAYAACALRGSTRGCWVVAPGSGSVLLLKLAGCHL